MEKLIEQYLRDLAQQTYYPGRGFEDCMGTPESMGLMFQFCTYR